MLLIEADGKALLAAHGIPVPEGRLATAPAEPDGPGPWVVKAQVPAGGRGRAGGIIRCATPAEVAAALRSLLGRRLKGHTVEACLVERAVQGAEHYLAVAIDPAGHGLRVISSACGGIDVEREGAALSRPCAADADAAAAALAALLPSQPRIAAIGRALAGAVLARELALAEINPLFVTPAACLAGDAKVVIDLNAIDRQPAIAALLAARPGIYADADRRMREGFDYVELDPEGEIGLVTTGAGLSMMLIDELVARGARPLNFCDIRTGQMRGSPARLIRVLGWITARPSLKAILVNIFAGITDLAEFAALLAAAIGATPALEVPVVARLVGRNAAEARRLLHQARPGMLVTEDLDEALARVNLIAQGTIPGSVRGSVR